MKPVRTLPTVFPPRSNRSYFALMTILEMIHGMKTRAWTRLCFPNPRPSSNVNRTVSGVRTINELTIILKARRTVVRNVGLPSVATQPRRLMNPFAPEGSLQFPYRQKLQQVFKMTGRTIK